MAVRKKRQQKKISTRILYWGSHVLCAVVAILVFLTMVQCTIKKPEAPSWQTSVVVPLTNKTWDMQELIEKIDQDNLTVDSTGTPMFYYHDDIDTVTIAGSFSIPDIVETVQESLGLVTLDPITPTGFQVSLASQFPGVPAGTFPDTSYTVVNDLPALGNFTMATIDQGIAQFVIVNDFGLNLDTVIVTIQDVLASRQVATYSIPGGINAGASSVDTIDLGGQTISNQLAASIHFHAQSQTSFTLTDKSMSASVGMPAGLTVSSATAVLPAMTKDYSSTFDIESEHIVQSATLSSGRLVLDISNQTNAAANLLITFPDFVNGSNPLQISRTVYAQSGGQFYYDLSNYALEPIDQALPQSLEIQVSAGILSSGGIVTINAGDEITVTATVDNLEMATVSGIIGETTAEFDSLEQEIDVPTGFDNISLPSAVIVLEVENTVNIPGSFSISVDGDQGQHKTLSGVIAPGTLASPSVTIITDSNLTAFMNPIPEVFTVTGSATFGDGTTSGSISANDFVLASVTISSPMEMVIDSSLVEGEWTESEIDIDSSVVNSFKNAQFHADIENHLPVGITVEILMSGDSATLYTNPEVVLGPVTVNAGVVNAEGVVTEATLSETVLTMDSEDIQVLHNDTLWIGENLLLHSTDGQTIKMSAADYLRIIGYIDLDVNFSDDLWEDN
ncbi:MAG: hypothetical protein R3F48_09910 [Candidatus Zixiibacteriota bacterium]